MDINKIMIWKLEKLRVKIGNRVLSNMKHSTDSSFTYSKNTIDAWISLMDTWSDADKVIIMNLANDIWERLKNL